MVIKLKDLLLEATGDKLYRKDDLDYIRNLFNAALKNGSVKTKGADKLEYTSLSKSRNGWFTYTGLDIVFNRNELGKLNNLIDIKYDYDTMKNNPKIFHHVINNNMSIEQYFKVEKIKSISEFNKAFKDYYGQEKEILAPNPMKVNIKCIDSIEVPKFVKKEFQKYEKHFNIIYQ